MGALLLFPQQYRANPSPRRPCRFFPARQERGSRRVTIESRQLRPLSTFHREEHAFGLDSTPDYLYVADRFASVGWTRTIALVVKGRQASLP